MLSAFHPEPSEERVPDLKDARLSVRTMGEIHTNTNRAASYTAIGAATLSAIADLLSGGSPDVMQNAAYPLLAGLVAGSIVTLGTTPLRRECRALMQDFFRTANAADRDRAADLLLDRHLDPADFGYDRTS